MHNIISNRAIMFYIPNPSFDATDSGDNANSKTESEFPLPNYETELNILAKDLKFLREYALSGNLKISRLRSVHWRVLLGVLPSSSAEWSNVIQEMRLKYHNLKTNFTLDPRQSPCAPNDNPLSQDENSVWYRYFCDVELKRIIRQDVIRTSPEKQFFQLPQIQEIMVNVLFVYARENPDICYRQGMHEIVALLLYVIHEDCQQIVTNETTLLEVLDPKYLEHDLFHLFTAIMKRLGQFYESDYSNIPNACGHFPSSLPNDSRWSSNIPFSFENIEESGISLHVNSVIRNYLAANDPALYQHLKKLNIPHTVFGIRWLRLLFGREFPLADLFLLWDAIFAVDCDFVLVNHILVAMLIAIRNELLHHDYVHSLNQLMNYPKTVDILHIIRLALHLKDPIGNKKPAALAVLKNGSNRIPSNSDSITSKTVNLPSSSKLSTINSKKTKNMKWNIAKKVSAAVYAEPKNNGSSSSKNYEKMVAELKHMRVVMSLCKLKLFQYHDILAASIEDDDLKAQHALTGIKELCTLLEIDHFSTKSSPSDERGSAVDTAREMKDTSTSHTNDVSSPLATDDAVAMCLPPPKANIDMTTFMFIELSLKDPSNFPPECPHIVSAPVTNETDYEKKNL